MGGDSLLMRLYGNLLEVGSKAKGGRCGQIAPAGLHGWLPICETCLPCPLSGCLSDCFSCPRNDWVNRMVAPAGFFSMW